MSIIVNRGPGHLDFNTMITDGAENDMSVIVSGTGFKQANESYYYSLPSGQLQYSLRLRFDPQFTTDGSVFTLQLGEAGQRHVAQLDEQSFRAQNAFYLWHRTLQQAGNRPLELRTHDNMHAEQVYEPIKLEELRSHVLAVDKAVRSSSAGIEAAIDTAAKIYLQPRNT